MKNKRMSFFCSDSTLHFASSLFVAVLLSVEFRFSSEVQTVSTWNNRHPPIMDLS